VLSLGIYTVLFAAVFKFVPDVKISWRDTWVGGALTAVLFLIGKYGLSFYLSRGSATSVFGAAGSLAALLIWIYYSAQIFFFGAEFTQVYARRMGNKILPDDDAVALDGAERAKAGLGEEKTSGSPTRDTPWRDVGLEEAREPARPKKVREMSGPRNGWAPQIVAAGGLALGVAAGIAAWLRERHDPVRRARMDLAKWRLDKLESRLSTIQKYDRRAHELDIDRRLSDTASRCYRAQRELHKSQWKR